ncbi:putative F-box protein At1g65770 isoform X4 [Camellia sinensis]|uniref:putative F-box protein At1g65770 isoform X4 n=1 Tax=Camellia sinensis TaxID=4442 RepID=UPI00103612A5|nr:putative F-box protein At1g65770 isoform X4 [Camellia sinensis]
MIEETQKVVAQKEIHTSNGVIQVMADWSKLPDEIWRLIVKRQRLIEDYVRFGGVCRSWHLITLEKENYSCSELPWVMLTENETSNIREFHSIFSNKVYKLYLPDIRGRRCWGSSHGWLVTVGTDREMNILNPLTRVQIPLPPLHKCPNLKKLICTPKEFRNYFVCKAVLSSNPSDPNCIVMAIYSDHRKMAFTKLSGKAWTPLECSPVWLEDIVHLNNYFYAVDSFCNVLVFDCTGSHLKTISFTMLQEEREMDYEAKYLVELGAEIYMVLRCLYDTRIADTPYLKTWGFVVYKLDLCSEKCEEVDGLGDWCIFLGSNYSFSISASCADLKCRKNCIYFTDDYYGMYSRQGSYDMGLYDLDSCKMEPCIVEHVSHYDYSVPLWIRPSLW